MIAARLNELLDSIKCRPVLARLRAQGYSEHVAQARYLSPRLGCSEIFIS